MLKKTDKNMWSRGYHLKSGVRRPRRSFMWHPDTTALLAGWLGFKQGQTVVDVGCGLGYLGMLYWPFFGKRGNYWGVDISLALVQKAARSARRWAIGGNAAFKSGDAYALPLPDDFADMVMCQTLMIHLGDPKRALAEMVRVTKPGGLVFCQESDMISAAMTLGYDSLPEKSIDEILFRHKFHILAARGRAMLGCGDYNIAPKIPALMSELGLRQIDARNTNKVDILMPPYETAEQRHDYRFEREMYATSDWDKRHRIGMKEYKRHILAGGGTMKDFQRFAKMTAKQSPDFQAQKKQLLHGTYAEFTPRIFYVIKGSKPK
ncbi:MAG: methyltransferase domain-containing protein [Candidatus Edwardsbacteria bacterium]|nr:methyltransferase domain-containing protein [Candidatus Edwardsbacteria bacterium]